jgi:hypothetical protein
MSRKDGKLIASPASHDTVHRETSAVFYSGFLCSQNSKEFMAHGSHGNWDLRRTLFYGWEVEAKISDA